MSKRYRYLTSGAIGAALMLGSIYPAAADSERAWWIQTLREHQMQNGTTVGVTPTTQRRAAVAASPVGRAPASTTVTSVTRPRGNVSAVAAAQSAPVYRMVGGRVMPLEPTVAEQQRTIIHQAAVAPAAPSLQIDPQFLPTEVSFSGYAPGTIVIDTEEKYLYLAMPGGVAKRYGVGVGRPGFQWAGTHRISRKAEWPGWTPPPQMRKRQPELPAYMEGGPNNPLGARAMYLGSSLYRIHGSNAPWTIGHEVSSGCIRMRNEDVVDLYERVKVGTKVVVIR
ncbi:L,D-transpeptidase [Acuticoccus sediminis]|nr:L,D-transpeptidase [Acuticoccus sediminis]